MRTVGCSGHHDLTNHANACRRHPHRDAEIFSYIVDGKLSHADSMGNSEALGRGSVQFMSAGTGVTPITSRTAHPLLQAVDYGCMFVPDEGQGSQY